jgi:hypothetical protein
LATRALLPFILLSCLMASSALADGIILATGMSGGSNGGSWSNPLAAGAVDSNWTLTGAAGTSTYVLGNYTNGVGAGNNWSTSWTMPVQSYTWGASGAGNAGWIGAAVNDNDPNLPKYTSYSFTTTFNLGSVTSSTVLTIYWAIDDGGTLYINNNQVSTQDYGKFGTPTTLVVPYTELHSGPNTLTVTMTNQDDAVNDGMILYATVTGSPVPAPAALLLFAPGLAALVLMRRRLKK